MGAQCRVEGSWRQIAHARSHQERVAHQCRLSALASLHHHRLGLGGGWQRHDGQRWAASWGAHTCYPRVLWQHGPLAQFGPEIREVHGASAGGRGGATEFEERGRRPSRPAEQQAAAASGAAQAGGEAGGPTCCSSRGAFPPPAWPCLCARRAQRRAHFGARRGGVDVS